MNLSSNMRKGGGGHTILLIDLEDEIISMFEGKGHTLILLVK